MKKDQWIQRWRIESETEPGKVYTVARKSSDQFGCSCPRWVFQRAKELNGQCKHIRAVLSPEVMAAVKDRRFHLSLDQEKIRVAGWLINYEEREASNSYVTAGLMEFDAVERF